MFKDGMGRLQCGPGAGLQGGVTKSVTLWCSQFSKEKRDKRFLGLFLWDKENRLIV